MTFLAVQRPKNCRFFCNASLRRLWKLKSGGEFTVGPFTSFYKRGGTCFWHFSAATCIQSYRARTAALGTPIQYLHAENAVWVVMSCLAESVWSTHQIVRHAPSIWISHYHWSFSDSVICQPPWGQTSHANQLATFTPCKILSDVYM